MKETTKVRKKIASIPQEATPIGILTPGRKQNGIYALRVFEQKAPCLQAGDECERLSITNVLCKLWSSASKCGNIKHDLRLSDRIYHCNVCSLSIDRDLNAAINILHMGLIKVGKNVGGGTPELTPVESATAAELSKGGLRVVTL